jgi:hypothetical protein
MRVADDIKEGQAATIARGEVAPARAGHAEQRPQLTWREGPNRTYIAASQEFSFSIADRGRNFVVLASLRLKHGQLFRAKHQPHVIGVTCSLQTAKTLCERYRSEGNDE